MTLYYPPTQNGLQKELDAQLDQGVTAALTLNNVTGVPNNPGVVLINRVSSGGTPLSAAVREWVIYTGTSGNTLTGLTRGVGGSTDQDHAVGSIVEFVTDITWAQGIIDTILAEHDTSGAHTKTGADTALVSGTAGTNGNLSSWNADGDLVDASITATGAKTATITFIIDGGGTALSTGIKGDLEIPFACTITQATALADQSGSVVVDIWKDTYANYPPTDADSITASAPVTISTATKAQDATLTGWTTSISAGDTLRFNVDSCTTITRVTVSLKVTKS